MALRENIRNIDNNINYNNTLQQQNQIKKLKKEELQEILLDAKFFLKFEIKELLQLNGSNYSIYLQSAKAKAEIKNKLLNSFEIDRQYKI